MRKYLLLLSIFTFLSFGSDDDTSITNDLDAPKPTYSISVTAGSNRDYTLEGTGANGEVSGNDASITISVGDTISFSINTASHPFYIKTVQGIGTGNQASGVSNNDSKKVL